SVTKTKAATYELKWIEDLVPELWSPMQFVRIKSLLDAVRITAAQIYVNIALMKLVLLMNFKENILSSYYCWYKS
ncbi:hypothetical protein Tco_0426683, partial [Tanacetum coccineum]